MTKRKKTHSASKSEEALRALDQAYEYYTHQPLGNDTRHHYSDWYTDLSKAT